MAYSTTLLRGKEKIVDEDHASSLLKHVDDLLDCIDYFLLNTVKNLRFFNVYLNCYHAKSSLNDQDILSKNNIRVHVLCVGIHMLDL